MSHNELPSPTPRGAPQLDNFLDSWKEIGAYLGREVRTVQRWEKKEGLPVHRQIHEKLSTVYAYKSEIDAWYRERRPQLERELENEQSVPAPEPRKSRWMIAVPTLLAVAGLLSLGAYFARHSSWLHARPVPGKIKLAVLPFQNLTGNPNQEYFSDGMTEEMITQLGRLQPERLGVIARTSAMTYKNAQKSTPQICQELGVDYILEGSVRRADNRARITAQLIQCSDQTHLWADSSERDVVNILSLQAEVAEAVARNIQVALKPNELARLSGARQVNPEAYEAYLKGLYFWDKFTPDAAQTAIKYFQIAIEKDPEYARAYAALSNCYVYPEMLKVAPPHEASSRARTAAARAAALDGNSAEAHVSLAMVAGGYDWNWAASEQEYRQAIALNPNLATAHLGYGLELMLLRRPNEAWTELRTAQALDPVSQSVGRAVLVSLYWSRRYEEALALAKPWLESSPGAPGLHAMLGHIYAHKDMQPQAVEEYLKDEQVDGASQARVAELKKASRKSGLRGFMLERLALDKELVGKGNVTAYDIASEYAGLGYRDQAFLWLEKAYASRDYDLVELGVHPSFDSLRADPRFHDLLHRIGLQP